MIPPWRTVIIQQYKYRRVNKVFKTKVQCKNPPIGAYLVFISRVKESLDDEEAPVRFLAIIGRPTLGVNANDHVECGV